MRQHVCAFDDDGQLRLLGKQNMSANTSQCRRASSATKIAIDSVFRQRHKRFFFLVLNSFDGTSLPRAVLKLVFWGWSAARLNG